MKKFCLGLILIFCAFCAFGCSCGGVDPSISFAKSKITINMGNIYRIEDQDVSILHSHSGYECVVLDESIARVENNIIIPLKEGVTTLRIQLIDNNSFGCEVVLRVTNIVYATTAEIEYEELTLNLMKDNGEIFNRLIVGDNVNEVPNIQYDSTIIEYDYKTGLLKGKQTGVTVVSIVFNNVNVSFNVSVVNWVYTQVIEVEDCSVFEGDTGVFTFVKFPSSANTYTFSTDSDKITVNSDGSYIAHSIGSANVKCAYISEENGEENVVEFVVTIYEKFTSFDLAITDTDGKACPYYLPNETYRLNILNVNVSDIDRVNLKTSINILSKRIIDGKMVIDFTFKDVGVTDIMVNINMGDYVVSESISVKVSSISDTKVWGKYSYTQFSSGQDNTFMLYLSDSSRPSYVKFFLKLEGAVFTGQYQTFLLDEDNEVVLNNAFYPTAAGEYTVIFKQNDTEFNRVKIYVYA